MHDPVVAADGYTYERQEIESWIRRSEGKEIRSPMTSQVLPYLMLAPNCSMRKMIIKALEDNITQSSLSLVLSSFAFNLVAGCNAHAFSSLSVTHA
jgi:hypothetical protein